MLYVCRNHVKEGVSTLQTPHVKKIKSNCYTCSFVSCNVQAEYKLFSPFTTSNREILMKVSDEKISGD